MNNNMLYVNIRCKLPEERMSLFSSAHKRCREFTWEEVGPENDFVFHLQ